ncbi:MAG: NrfD/PsrC family molybdoenzyme membrane anchor subunit [Terriglobales bacterium]|jgi:molybdopterin-containing oxidoreductase family membrane subunit
MVILTNASTESRKYWLWVSSLLCVILAGSLCYVLQLRNGLAVTGLSRDVSWGLYIAQFTFFVGIAASAVMVVLPYYLHDYRQFGRLTLLGELLAVTAVTMCMLFIFVDLGQPSRIFNIVLHPQPQSVMFWDMIALSGYLLMNAVIAVVTLTAQRQQVPVPGWIKGVVIFSIPWAISIHTVTAFLYSGLPGRSYWLTAVLAPRFLASAFASGPALLILLCLALRKLTGFDAGREAIQKLAVIVTYALSINIFLILAEVFTAFYSDIPAHEEPFKYLFIGLNGDYRLVPWMWLSVLLSWGALALLLVPKWRANVTLLVVACACVFVSIWLDKGLGLIVGGMVPSPLGAVTRYVPTLPESTIVLGIWAIGALMITVFYRITLSVWKEN